MVAISVVGAPVGALVSLGSGAFPDSPASTPKPLRVLLDNHELIRVDPEEFDRNARVDRRALTRALRAGLPPRITIRKGRGRVSYRIDVTTTITRAAAEAPRGGDVAAAAVAFAVRIPARATRQRLRNNCETASLSILLATAGRAVPQLTLQSRLRRSGPLDPIARNGERIWGDPELGYVGRAAGGGVAGGFGVYERPILEVARMHASRVLDLSRQPPAAIYGTLLAGRAVMVWVGLSDGPYREWMSSEGRPIRANLGEHAVVLTGVHANGDLRVVNPLRGTRERWRRTDFEVMWQRLGRRAVSV